MYIGYHEWVSLSSALLTPTIAIAGIYIAYRQWKTNDMKRQNDLFDRRYEFYIRLRNWWLSAGRHNQEESGRPYDGAELEDLIPWAEEADFLFGDDIHQYILSLEGEVHSGSPYFPNEEFISPFRNYLRLK